MRLLGKIARDKGLPRTLTERDLRIELARQKRELDEIRILLEGNDNRVRHQKRSSRTSSSIDGERASGMADR